MDQVTIGGGAKPITILALRVMELFTPRGINDNNHLIMNYVTQSSSLAPLFNQINAASTLSDGSPFDQCLMRSLQKLRTTVKSPPLYFHHLCIVLE